MISKEVMSKIARKIKRYDYISFDVFDTLIFRNVSHPHDVFDVIEKKYNQSHLSCSLSGFREYRISCEILASKKNDYYTISDIYNEMLERFSYNVVEELKKIEIETEIDMTYPASEMKNIFEEMKRAGKHVLIISDMYLHTETIAALLRKNGYDGWEEIYVSCDYRASKRDGKIFKIVKQDIRSSNICHIGDNFLSDYIMARLKGVNSVFVKR